MFRRGFRALEDRGDGFFVPLSFIFLTVQLYSQKNHINLQSYLPTQKTQLKQSIYIIYIMQKYKIQRTLGDGTFGIVFQAITANHETVAIKKMKQKYKNIDQCVALREVKSLRKLDHPNLIKLRQVILANSELYLVFDYVEYNLFQMYTRAKESHRTLTESQIKAIFYKMTLGLAYLHRSGYFHRDLKPQNVLVKNDQLKICDFGLAREIRSKPPYTQYVSTRWYRAPELLLRSGTYNSPVDIFALACIVIELYMMEPLFPGNNEIQTMNKIVEVLGTPKKEDWPEGYKLAATLHYNFPERKKKHLYQIIPNADLDVIDLLESMLSYSFRKRPSAIEILKHPYFENYKLKGQAEQGQEKQTKISFYDKNPIELPKNVVIQNPKDMEMRKTTIKFGNSFGSSFHKEKLNEEKQQNPHQFNSKSEKKKSHSKKKKIEDDDINKKFDEMEEILLQLKMRQTKEKQKSESMRENKYETVNATIAQQQNKEELRMPIFSLAGMASTNNINRLVKSPVVKKMTNTRNV